MVDSRYGTTERVYDPDGRLIRITTPEGTIRYAYDPETGQKTRMWTDRTDIRYAYDALGRLATVTAIELNDTALGTPLVTAYTYDVVGNLVATAQANGTTESRTYDDLGRLLSVAHTNASSTVLASFVYTLDASGHRVAVDERGGRSVEYTYDALYRLTKEKILQGGVEERVVVYTYDLVGNRLTKTDSAYEWYEYDGFVRYTYDAQDRLVFEDGADYYAGDVTYTYDANGNTLTRVDSEHGTTTTYTWDIAGRLVGATIVDSSGTRQLTYTYDSDGMRTGSSVNSQETTSLIDKQQAYDQVLEEYAPGGALAATYVHGLDLIFQDRQGTRSSYHADGLGSVRALSNAAGAVTDTYTYDAYGQVIERVGTTANDYQFTGEQYDANLKQTYLRARYYDAAAGRFTRMDTYEGQLGRPLSLQKFVYAAADPVNHTDPSGRDYSLTSTLTTMLNSSLNFVIRVGQLAEVKNKVESFVGLLQFLYDLYQGGFGRVVQDAYDEVNRRYSAGGSKILQSITLADAEDAFRKTLPEIPKIASAIAKVPFLKSLLSAAIRNPTDYRLVIFLPDITSARYSGELAKFRLPGVEVGGFKVEASIPFGGSRLFGFGFRKRTERNVGYQLFRVDYHARPSIAQDPTFVHDSRFIGNIQLDSGITLHWQVPENQPSARARW